MKTCETCNHCEYIRIYKREVDFRYCRFADEKGLTKQYRDRGLVTIRPSYTEYEIIPYCKINECETQDTNYCEDFEEV